MAGFAEVPIFDSSLTSGVHVGGTTEYVGLAWCAGTLTVESDGSFTCDGTRVSGLADTNLAQSDSFLAEVTGYAVQARNNEGFECEIEILAPSGPPPTPF